MMESNKNNVENRSFNDMLIKTKIQLEKKQSVVTHSVSRFFNDQKMYIIFLSASDGKSRARVVTGRGNTFNESWQKASQRLKRTILLQKIKPIWLKADIVTTIETVRFDRWMSNIGLTRRNYFRKGISFDRDFIYAFLEQETNGHVFFRNWHKEYVEIDEEHIHIYAKKYRRMKRFNVRFDRLKEVYLFNTFSLFHDGNEIFEQHDGLYNHGVRKLQTFHVAEVHNIIELASKDLVSRMKENGSFHYEIYPAFHKNIDSYNMTHHSLTVLSMIYAFTINRDKSLLEAIDNAITYILRCHLVQTKNEGRIIAFIKDNKYEKEYILGPIASSLLTIIAYIKHIYNKYYIIIYLLDTGLLYF